MVCFISSYFETNELEYKCRAQTIENIYLYFLYSVIIYTDPIVFLLMKMVMSCSTHFSLKNFQISLKQFINKTTGSIQWICIYWGFNQIFYCAKTV
jgi:hypothetical protein